MVGADHEYEPPRFRIQGALSGSCVAALEDAWRSVCAGPEGSPVILDLTEVDSFDESGVALLSRMRESGARLIARPRPPG